MKGRIFIFLLLSGCFSNRQEIMDLDAYLHQYWLLRDHTIIDVYKLPKGAKDKIIGETQVPQDTETVEVGDYTIINYNSNCPILLASKSIQKALEVGLEPTSGYFQFEKDSAEFLNKRFEYIDKLPFEGSLPLNYEMESLDELQRYIYENKWDCYEVESNFLGLLAYCGECICKKINGTWKITSVSSSDTNWYPIIESNGIQYDVFRHFYESLIEYEEGDFPTIVVDETNLFTNNTGSHRGYRKGFPSHDDFSYTVLNEDDINNLRYKQTMWVLADQQPSEADFSAWKIDSGAAVVYCDIEFTKGLLFNSESEYLKMLASFKE